MKIALVHDYLNEAGGAERVLRVLSEMYPDAPIYTAFAKNGSARAMFSGKTIRQSKWAPILRIGRMYSYLRFLLPWIWRSIDLSDYDMVITSCSGYIARGFVVGEKTKVVAYCHTPPKWLYYYETPTGAGRKWWGQMFMWVVGPFVRYFDYKSAERVDVWIANSKEVAGRIKKFYRKDATVVYPPVQMALSNKTGQKVERDDYYLIVSRLTGAKGVSEAIKGAKKAQIKLKVVGERLMRTGVERPNYSGVEYLGRVDDSELPEFYAKARGFVALARDEDFGMTVVEAMSMGTPVLALNSGGYRETVLSADNQTGRTGLLIEDTRPETVAAGITKMEKTKWDHKKIAEWGRSFNRARFTKEFYARVARG